MYYINYILFRAREANRLVMKKIVFTDLEPDDLIALTIIKDMDIVIVGEGNANIKYERAKKYLPNITILEGMSSKNIFPNDGKDVGIIMKDETKANYDENNMIKIITDNTCQLIIMKPPRELYNIWKKFPMLMNKHTTYLSGSFNLRSLVGRSNPDEWNNVILFLESFNKCFIYENHHAIGPNNNITFTELGIDSPNASINAKKLIELYGKLDMDSMNKSIDKLLPSKIPKEIQRAIFYWDMYNLKDSQDTVAECDEKLKKDPKSSRLISQKERNEKCAKQIISGNFQQFVASDVFFAICIDDKSTPWKTCELDFNRETGYSIPKEVLNSTIYFAMPKDKKEFRDKLIKKLL